MKKPPILRIGFVTLSLFLVPLSAFAQGSLTPPGPPGPTMKTLDQLDTHMTQAGEKRIDVLTLPGDSIAQFIISAPGSYYLSGNITGTSGKHGIIMRSDDVTLDLNGFALIGVTGSLNGIVSERKNIGVRNGTIRGWDGAGINMLGANAVLEELSASGNVVGISASGRCVIYHCVARNNGANGIYASTDSAISGHVIKDCVISGNGDAGIEGPFATMLISGCVAVANKNGGIHAGPSSTIKDCVANQSTNGGYGISASTGVTITGSTAHLNEGDGIRVDTGCVVLSNTCRSNGTYGIHATGRENRIESNAAIDNPTGFKFDSDGNLIIKNSNRGGTGTAFNLAAGNSVGEMINVYNGGAGATITTSNSWANFLY